MVLAVLNTIKMVTVTVKKKFRDTNTRMLGGLDSFFLAEVNNL